MLIAVVLITVGHRIMIHRAPSRQMRFAPRL
jgi:hypothetical protein